MSELNERIEVESENVEDLSPRMPLYARSVPVCFIRFLGCACIWLAGVSCTGTGRQGAFPGLRSAPNQGFESIRGYRGKVFLGLGTAAVKLQNGIFAGERFGLKVIRVAAGSSADAAGIKVGDVIVSMDGQQWTNEKIRLSRSFGKAGEKFTPGESVSIEFFRSDVTDRFGRPRVLESKFVLQRYPGTFPELPSSPTNAELRPDWENRADTYRDLCWQLIRASGYEADSRDLLERLERAEEFPDPHRLPMVRYVHRDPFMLEPISREIIGGIPKGQTNPGDTLPVLFGLAEQALSKVGLPGGALSSRLNQDGLGLPSFSGKNLNAHLDYIAAVLKAAAEKYRQAFEKLAPDEVRFIVKHRDGMLDSYINYRMLSYDDDGDRQRASVRLLELAGHVNRSALFEQARIASLLVRKEFTDSLAAAAKASGKNLGRGTIAQRKTPFGLILVSGRGRTRYQKQDAAAIFDLGGNDVYANNSASSVVGKIPTAVLVDYEGNDAYENEKSFTQACGDFGVGILADLAGDDSYVGRRFTQGAGFLGIGALIDVSGNDVYRGLEFNQGVGHFGAGLLLDGAGNDRYESLDTSQAVGLSGGCGLLTDAGTGSDSYYCKGKEPTGYGTPGIFEGWGQGMGVGYRPYASGGIGVLFDQGGPDRFEAGNFSQGGGYFYGFGVFYSAGADSDQYIGSRYAQGFGCHQAAGAFIEEGGDDVYMTRNAVAQGLAWDEAVGLFLEEAGNDRYEGGGFSQGASAMNGWTIFVDRQGRDTYLYTDQARAGGNTYHGGTSLSFFLDEGGQEDKYPSKPNNAFIKGGAKSLFLDLPGTAKAALEGQAWKKLMRGKPDK